MRFALLLAAATLVTVPGCVTPEPAAATTPLTDDYWGDASSAAIVDTAWGGVTADALCMGGGAPRIKREPPRIVPGVTHLSAELAGDGYRGFELGYVLDDTPAGWTGDQEGITWFPAHMGGTASYEMPVREGEHENLTGPRLWAFFWRINPGAEEACFTGAGAGDLRLTITAWRDV